jgi:hypothetical protein
MHQFGKVVLFLFFVNYFVDKEEKISEIGSNVTYGNMSLVNVPNSDYQNYQYDYNQFQTRNINNTCIIIHNYGEIGYFQALLNLIQVLAERYFDVFQTCYLRSINIIYYLVTDYFLVFNRLFFSAFGQVVTLVNNIIMINFVNGYHAVTLLFSTSNFAMLCFVLMYHMYLGQERLLLQNNRNNNQNRNRNRNQNN